MAAVSIDRCPPPSGLTGVGNRAAKTMNTGESSLLSLRSDEGRQVRVQTSMSTDQQALPLTQGLTVVDKRVQPSMGTNDSLSLRERVGVGVKSTDAYPCQT